MCFETVATLADANKVRARVTHEKGNDRVIEFIIKSINKKHIFIFPSLNSLLASDWLSFFLLGILI